MELEGWGLVRGGFKKGGEETVVAPEIFLRMFLKKHKFYNLIKKEIHILAITTIKKTHKYIKFIIAFYEFSYFEIGLFHYQCYKLYLFQYTQPSNHSSTKCRTNYGAKFNFIRIKKTEGVPKFFLKVRKINLNYYI